MVAEETYYEWVEDEKDIDIVNEESTIAEENKEWFQRLEYKV